jgi:predicted GIY-YIG superfamily endonuclease
MAESLYVCAFDNGAIKVGRSIDPVARIAQHEERVSCAGVLLAQKHIVECVGHTASAESALIARCADSATKRLKHEWFFGLAYSDVCDWANEYAKAERPAVVITRGEDGRIDFSAVIRALSAAGVNQVDMAARCKCSQPTISDLQSGRIKEPSYSIGEALLEMLRAA